MAAWSPPPSPRDDPRRTPSPRASSSRSRSAPRRQRSQRRRRASPATETARTERPEGAARPAGTQEMALLHPCRLLSKLFHYYFECGQLRARQGRARSRKPIPDLKELLSPVWESRVQRGRSFWSFSDLRRARRSTRIHAPLLAHTFLPRPPAGLLGPVFWARTPAHTRFRALGTGPPGAGPPRPCPAEPSLADQLMTGLRCR